MPTSRRTTTKTTWQYSTCWSRGEKNESANNGNVTVQRLGLLAPRKQSLKFRPDDKAVKEVIQAFGNPPNVPEIFEITTSPYDPTKPKKTEVKNVIPVINPQTETFCAKLAIKNPCYSKEIAAEMYTNREEIGLGGDSDDNDVV